MSKEEWAQIKKNKNFNVHIFRRGLTFLIFLLACNIVMGVLISFIYLNEPEHDFYATSGIAPPVQLKPMAEPNKSSQPLLEPDPPTDDTERVIPE